MNRSAAARREFVHTLRIPYTAHVAAGVIKTGADDFVQTWRIAGASFETADDDQLNTWHERLNVTWRNIASTNVSLWMHVIRRREYAAVIPPATSGGFAAHLSAKYRNRLAGETLMMNELYLSVVYRPITGAATGLASRMLFRREGEKDSGLLADALDACEKLGQAVSASLSRYEPEQLTTYERDGRHYSRLIEFFGLLINGEWQAMPLSRVPLAELLGTTRPLFGSEVIEYRMPTRTRFGGILGIKEYPASSQVGMFNALLSAPFECVLTQSFSFISKAAAQGLLQRQYNRMSNAGDFAISQAEELREALDQVTANDWVMGDHHLTLQVLSEPYEAAGRAVASDAQRLKRLNDDLANARALLADTGMTVAREDLALEGAFWAQLPAVFALRPRRAPITSRNFSAMAPWHNHPSGRETGNHWGDALALLITRARSPYYFSLHASDPTEPDGGSRKDTGHTFICGPTGCGKTVVIGFFISLLAARNVTQVIFDKDYGLEILTRALGGRYFDLRNGQPTGFNPLQLEPTPTNVEFLQSFLRTIARGPAPFSTRELSDLEQALRGTLALELSARRLSRLIEFTDPTRPEGIHARLARWCYSTRGEHAWVFDNDVDLVVPELRSHATIGFDVTNFLQHDLLRGPVNRYLFHIVEQLLDGRRLVCWVDEFSHALADPDFESFADNGPKTWRKLDGALCVATQAAEPVLNSRIARTIVESTATKIFFPNPDASPEDYMAGFGLTEREFDLLKHELEPGSRMFLIKQGHWSVVAKLDLVGFEPEIAVISGRKSSVEELRRIIAQVGTDPMQWLQGFMSRHAKH